MIRQSIGAIEQLIGVELPVAVKDSLPGQKHFHNCLIGRITANLGSCSSRVGRGAYAVEERASEAVGGCMDWKLLGILSLAEGGDRRRGEAQRRGAHVDR